MSTVLPTLLGVGVSAVAGATTIGLDAPPAIETASTKIEAMLEFAGGCADEHPDADLTHDYEIRDDRYSKVRAAVQGVWPSDQADDDSGPERMRSCDKPTVLATLAQVDRALDSISEQFVSTTAGLRRGTWIGSLKLCRGTVQTATTRTEPRLNSPELVLTLSPDASRYLAAMTKRGVGYNLAVRFEGKIVAAPHVNEQITRGTLQISDPDRIVLEQMARTIPADC